ncbi:hypothetical protein [Aequorivita marisscotiae]|uniref:Uncharacterized protein n=1 Tax=Aequorivita marisscotiae TaxID=3040348 RepID=A0ABY8KTP3_9FLAO|nr:hypothetical protein [Aequorivita sp. Ant34-E75]WGF91525.1 hypothetical protein QCQ61_09925 [Aequorivita sp. Ant34-E75]
MGSPHKKQKLQDWLTQQWVILFGRKIDKTEEDWLLGPFGGTQGIGLKFINQLAEKEQLIIDTSQKDKGLIESIEHLNLPASQLKLLSKNVIDFYENTSNYEFDLKVKWNPLFKNFGRLLRLLFSNRIEQLNVPIENIPNSRGLTSEIIQLRDAQTKKLKRTLWLRTFKASGKIVYSGVYETCTLPSGKSCIKAIFPLPNGNATVILAPMVGKKGELILSSAGKQFGDSGFYFLLNDSNGKLWAKYIKSFKDRLVAKTEDEQILVKQTLTLWGLKVLIFEYNIRKRRDLDDFSQ